MQGLSSKEAQSYTAGNPAGSNNMAEFNQPAPPPPYSQQAAYPGGTTIGPSYIAPSAVTVTQQPGVTVMQQGAHFGPAGSVTTTVMGNTVVRTVVLEQTVGSMPSLLRCRSCNQQMVTRVEYMPNGRTHIAALLLCIFGCWPCACLPYCVSSCQTANHFCTNCGAYIGAY